jgi:hypothetical protein
MTVSIKELKKEVLEHNIPVSVLLRKAIIIARARQDSENEAWMTLELNGVQEGEEAPKHRIVSGQPVHFNRFVGWEMVSLQYVNDKDILRALTHMPIFGPITEIEAYAQQAELKLHYGNTLERLIQKMMSKEGQPAISIAGTTFQTILETVRNRLFDWVSQLPDEAEALAEVNGNNVMTTENKWKDSVEAHPLRYALLLIIGTAIVVAGIMGWVQKVREDNLTTRCEAEKINLKNDLEAQIRELKSQLAEAQKPKQIPK